MKIFLPFQIQEIGGTSTFVTKFKEGMAKRGHQVFFDFKEDYDILFLIAQAPFEYLLHAKRHKKKIVQRLDGVYYWSVASWKFLFLNAKAAYIRQFFTDFTVYQSRYSQYCVERFLGPKSSERSAVIYNGVNLKLFSPRGTRKNLRDNPKQRVFFTASAFRRNDQIIPIIKAFELYKKKYGSNCKLVVAGSFGREVTGLPERYRLARNLQFLGKVHNRDLPGYERAADVFLHTHLNPPCPNNVIEAMACGLPICGVADGAMRELVTGGDNGLLVSAVGDAFWRRRTIDVETFADNLHRIVENQGRFSAASAQAAKERFSLDAMIDSYINAFQAALE